MQAIAMITPIESILLGEQDPSISQLGHFSYLLRSWWDSQDIVVHSLRSF